MTQAEKAAHLRELHHSGETLVFVNAWDAVTARIIETLGYPAVATTSSGLANACGYRDGGAVPRDVMLDAVAAIARAVAVPVTADMEYGYGTDVEAAVATANGVIGSGAVGFNFEDETADGFIDLDVQCERIAAMREVGSKRGVPIVINARTDTFWHGTGDAHANLDAAIARGKRYLAAGADCIFIPGLAERKAIERAVKELGTINLLALGDVLPLEELQRIGVARVSFGSSPMLYAMAAFRDAAAGVRERGDTSFIGRRMPYDEANGLFA